MAHELIVHKGLCLFCDKKLPTEWLSGRYETYKGTCSCQNAKEFQRLTDLAEARRRELIEDEQIEKQGNELAALERAIIRTRENMETLKCLRENRLRYKLTKAAGAQPGEGNK